MEYVLSSSVIPMGPSPIHLLLWEKVKKILKRIGFAFKEGLKWSLVCVAVAYLLAFCLGGRLVFYDTIFGGKGLPVIVMLPLIVGVVSFVAGFAHGLFSYRE